MSKQKLLDELVVIDLESTCDEPRPSWRGEIIEVGVCLLNLESLKITNPRGILVKPSQTPITAFCTRLTTITPEMVEKEGISLDKAMGILVSNYKLNQRTWASWGDYDRNQLTGECRTKGIEFPGASRTHINLKNLLAVEHGWRSECGLDEALENLDLPLDGTHHRGVDDALNIAKLYAHHLQKIRGALFS